MFMSSLSLKTLIPSIASRPFASMRAFSWSSHSLGIISLMATMPAAAIIPACLMPPPINFLPFLAFSTNSFVPARMEPIGAARPFERQNMTLSTYFVISFASTPRAHAALKILAPSRWTGILCAFEISRISLIVSTSITVPIP